MINLSEDQNLALSNIESWFAKDFEENNQVLTLGGYAGTGKTTIMSVLRKRLGDDVAVAFMSFTGKATSVLRNKLEEEKVLEWNDKVSTIHSFMYNPVIQNHVVIDWVWKDMRDREQKLSIEEEYQYAPYCDLIIIDEASMLPLDLYADLLKYKKPILAVGDHGQLPPINSELNLMASPDIRLEKIHRQAENNPIIKLATIARTGQYIKYGIYDEDHKVVKIPTNDFADSSVERMVIDNDDETLVLVGTNKLRTRINQNVISKYRGENIDKKKPEVGDKIICLKNNRRHNIYNGMIGRITSINPGHKFPDLNYFITIKTFEGEIGIDVSKHWFLNNNKTVPENFEWYKHGEQFDYAFALTCHKAQGSEADRVIVFGSGFGEKDMRQRWLYTGITRAKKELYIVGD